MPGPGFHPRRPRPCPLQATIDIRGKVKGVTIDSCEQTKVIVDTVLSVVELINCKRMQIEVGREQRAEGWGPGTAGRPPPCVPRRSGRAPPW